MYLISLLSLMAVASAIPSPQPSPQAVSCTPTASTLWWVVSGLYYHESHIFSTPAHQNSWGYVAFNMTNSITGTTSQCEAASDQLNDFFYDTQSYDCEDLDPATGGGSSFTFNRPGKQLQVEQDWYCVEGANRYVPATLCLPSPSIQALEIDACVRM